MLRRPPWADARRRPRKTLAARHRATIACPITTGIFAWIAAHAAAEAQAAKEVTTREVRHGKYPVEVVDNLTVVRSASVSQLLFPRYSMLPEEKLKPFFSHCSGQEAQYDGAGK